MISQCMNEREQFKLMHVKNDLRRIMVLSNMTKFRLANPCQNKESEGPISPGLETIGGD